MKAAFFNLDSWQKEYLKSRLQLTNPEIELFFYEHVLNKNNFPEERDFEIISVFIDSKLDQEVLDLFPNLKLITTLSMGYDHIDITTCKNKCITVCYVPTYGCETVAEYTFALILALSRKIIPANTLAKEKYSFGGELLRGFDLKDKTLGIVGTGKIGKNVITIAQSFGMQICAYDVILDEDFAQKNNFSYISLEDLLKKSDIITLHVPYMQETHHLINDQNLNITKKGAYIINTSRGGVIDTKALLQALKSGQITGAGLDVLEEEVGLRDPLVTSDQEIIEANHQLINLPNVIVTPHNAYNSQEAVKRIIDTTVENIQKFLQESPQNLVPESK